MDRRGNVLGPMANAAAGPQHDRPGKRVLRPATGRALGRMRGILGRVSRARHAGAHSQHGHVLQTDAASADRFSLERRAFLRRAGLRDRSGAFGAIPSDSSQVSSPYSSCCRQTSGRVRLEVSQVSTARPGKPGRITWSMPYISRSTDCSRMH